MKILIVEDDARIAAQVAKGLTRAGFSVDVAADGLAGLERARAGGYAAAVVDVMLPGLDGLSLIERLRESGARLPVIILSAKRSVDERVRGLRAGGDDYLAKPFSFSELLARVNALIRRSTGEIENPRLSAGGLTLDLAARAARRGEREVVLQAREFALLRFLMSHAGRPVSKAMILESVWGYDFDPQTNVVDVLVCRLRDKVDKPFGAKSIRTIRGVGYVLDA